MKAKKITKALVLNKITVADLNYSEMGNVHGGADVTYTVDCTVRRLGCTTLPTDPQVICSVESDCTTC